MQVSIHKRKSMLDHPLLCIVGEFTGFAKSLQEGLVDFDDPEIYNVFLQGNEWLKASAPFVRSGGAGVTIREAMDRALGEFVERYCLLHYTETIKGEIVIATCNELIAKGERFVSPNMMPLFSEKQYKTRGFPFRKMTDDITLGWVKGLSLISGQEIYAPAQAIYLGYKETLKEPSICPATTSGAAMGYCYESATLKALYEVLERDAVMKTWYLRESPSKLRFAHRIELQNLLTRTQNKGFSYNLMLLPCELTRVYVTSACTVNDENVFPKFVIGGSANLNPIESCYKSLLESAQGIPFVKIMGLVHHGDRIEPNKMTDFDSNVTFYGDPRNFKYVSFLLESRNLVDVDDLPNNACGDTKGDLMTVTRELREKNIDTIVFDATLPSFERARARVVKVFCPQLVSLSMPSYPFLGNRSLRRLQNKMPHPYP